MSQVNRREDPVNQREKLIADILGYLNFSDGTPNSAFAANLNSLARTLSSEEGVGKDAEPVPVWKQLDAALSTGLQRLSRESETFQKADQAEAVLRLVFDELLPAYRFHHRDLLFHQPDEAIFTPFFLSRVFEAVLKEGGPWGELSRITSGVLTRINDFLGHRPVAALRDGRRMKPYPHESVATIPIWLEGAGASVGPYEELVEATLEILRNTDPTLLRRAWFDLEQLSELSIDPRAYDFDHPVNRRPNYQFGQWDPHLIDNQGYYRRYVLQQVTVDAILTRLEEANAEIPRKELLAEAGAVLAGTILMGSGVSGDGPGVHDSNTSLNVLMPHIAAYRDDFYKFWIDRLPEKHSQRLKGEAQRLRQPFAGARQHLNQALVRRRALQLQHVHLAALFSRIGYAEAAMEQAQVVPVASARMMCEIHCRMTAAYHANDQGHPEKATGLLAEIEDLLHRAIECGAIVDPWSILGFDAQFNLFHSMEDSCYDYRVDELIELIEDIFVFYARTEKEAAAMGNESLREELSERLHALADWWDQFATTEISTVEGISGHQAWESADCVAVALGDWHKASGAAGNIAFWRERVEHFHSPKAYALVVEALLERKDPVAAMALLMQWLSQADSIGLIEGSYVFYDMAVRWIMELWNQRKDESEKENAANDDNKRSPQERWELTQKFMDYLEAGSEELWEVPRLELTSSSGKPRRPAREEEEPEEEFDEDEESLLSANDDLFGAAYEDVVYHDTTDDGFEGEVFDGKSLMDDFELAEESDRINQRLDFHSMLNAIWQTVIVASATIAEDESLQAARVVTFRAWLDLANKKMAKLDELLDAVAQHQVMVPSATEELLVDYDRQIAVREVLTDRIISMLVELAEVSRLLNATIGEKVELPEGIEDAPGTLELSWQVLADLLFQAIHAGDKLRINTLWPHFIYTLSEQPLLYQPTSRGGDPRKVVASRALQQTLHEMLRSLPRLGLFYETSELLETIFQMERSHPVGQGGITEFDKMFDTGYRAIVECMVEAPARRSSKPGTPKPATDKTLVGHLEAISEPLMRLWIEHSRSIRFSPLEVVLDEGRWKDLKQFIIDYGADLFTQSFMNFGNLRAIMTQGVDGFLEWLAEKPNAEEEFKIVADIAEGRLVKDKAIVLLGVTIEAVLDNYNEYLDYNSSTTQSDRGDMLYTLLDFLRVVGNYERLSWNLSPLVTAHDILIRAGRVEAADYWEKTFAKQTSDIADEHQKQYQVLSQEYGMQLRSVADRLGERFIRPLTIGRLRALVEPAFREATVEGPKPAFDVLKYRIDELAGEPSGVGFVVPSWLEALEREADQLRLPGSVDYDDFQWYTQLPKTRSTLSDISRQINAWAENQWY